MIRRTSKYYSRERARNNTKGFNALARKGTTYKRDRSPIVNWEEIQDGVVFTKPELKIKETPDQYMVSVCIHGPIIKIDASIMRRVRVIRLTATEIEALRGRKSRLHVRMIDIGKANLGYLYPLMALAGGCMLGLIGALAATLI